MDLQILWFVLIAVLWSGYFLLEGFDFGVGMLLPFVPRNESERGAMFESIGPVWDGNEVWLVVAGGSDVRGLPGLVRDDVLGLLPRAAAPPVLPDHPRRLVRVARARARARAGARVWLWANAIGSTGIALVWGIALANLIHGVPIDSNGDYDGNLVDLFTGYTVFAGIAFVLLFAFHGATYLTLRTTGDLYERVAAAARRLAVPAVVGRRRVPDLDGRRRRRPQRQGRLPGRRAGRCSAIAALALAAFLVFAGRKRARRSR